MRKLFSYQRGARFSLAMVKEVYLNKVKHNRSRLIHSLKTLCAMHRPAAIGLAVILTMCFVTNSNPTKTISGDPERAPIANAAAPPTAAEWFGVRVAPR